MQVWTCVISVVDTTNNICYHGEYFQKEEWEIQAIASVFETTATPDIQGDANPREVIAGTGGFKDIGSMRRTWNIPKWEIEVSDINSGDWKLNEATTQQAITNLSIGHVKKLDQQELIDSQLQGAILTGK